MKYSLADCYTLYDFFNKDFFKDELETRLGKCKIMINPAEAAKYIGEYKYDDVGGLSCTDNGKNYIYLNKYVLNNKKILMNTLLHEMIHIYDNMVSTVRIYNNGHGKLWNQVANYASQVYGKDIGKIEQFVDADNWHRIEHNKLIRNTKTLKNIYLIKLKDQTIIPIKNLSNKEISELTETDILAIYKVKPNIEQNEKTRVKRYSTYEALLDDIAYGLTAEEEREYSKLNRFINLRDDCELIWLKRRYAA